MKTLQELLKEAYPPEPFKKHSKAQWRAYFKAHTWIPDAVVEKLLKERRRA